MNRNDGEQDPLLGCVPLDPPPRPRWRQHAAFFFVLVTEMLERTAFYALVCNMLLFLNSDPFDWASYNAVDAIFTVNGIAYLTAVLGGWLADAVLGKFRTVALAFVVYIAGYAFWPALSYQSDPHGSVVVPQWCGNNYTKNSTVNSSVDVSRNSAYHSVFLAASGLTESVSTSDHMESCTWAVYLSIVLVGIGYGTVRANIIPFGAHQFEGEDQRGTRRYFNWFYWSINIGAFLAFGLLGYIQQDLSYFWGYVAPLAVLVVSFITFLVGSFVYVMQPAQGSVITGVFSICKESLQECCRWRRGRDTAVLNALPEREHAPCCLDNARTRYGGSFSDNAVDDVRRFGKVLLVFLAMVPYWCVYYQMQTTFVVQGLHMQLDFDYKNDSMAAADLRPSFTMPAAWLSLFNVLFVIILIPILDRFVYPALDARDWTPSLKFRILIGMMFAMFAVVMAGGVERYRLEVYWENGTNHTHYQKIGNTYYLAAKLSVFFQLPQYALIGISEVFASVGGLELAYIYAPRDMQGIIMGFYWFAQGLGSFLGTASLAGFKNVFFMSWDHGNINCPTSPFTTDARCHLDYYFFFLAGLQLVGICLFFVLTRQADIGSSIVLRTREDGDTVIRAATRGAVNREGSRSASPYATSRSGSFRSDSGRRYS